MSRPCCCLFTLVRNTVLACIPARWWFTQNGGVVVYLPMWLCVENWQLPSGNLRNSRKSPSSPMACVASFVISICEPKSWDDADWLWGDSFGRLRVILTLNPASGWLFWVLLVGFSAISYLAFCCCESSTKWLKDCQKRQNFLNYCMGIAYGLQRRWLLMYW